MPGAAARLHLEGGRTVFFKGAPGDSPAVSLYEREMWAGSVLSEHIPMPRMLWAEQTPEWVAMVFEHIDNAEHADLSPRSLHIPRVLPVVNHMNAALSPCPSAAASPVAQNVYALRAKAAHMLPSGQTCSATTWSYIATRWPASTSFTWSATRCCITTCTRATS